MSCLFNTLSKFINIDSLSLRHNICSYLQNNPFLYEDMKTEDVILWSNEGHSSLQDYINNMRNQSTWGGAIEIKCFCNMYNIKVIVEGHRNSEKPEIVEFLPEINKDPKFFIKIKWNGGHYYT